MYKATISMMSSLAMAGFLLLGTGGLASAQSMSGTHHDKMHKHNKLSVTGCLQKGDQAGGYSLKGTDGKMYELKSDKVQLGDHVGHQIKVRGYVTAESMQGLDANHQEPSGAPPDNGNIDMTVTKVKMISSTCSSM